MGGWEYFVLSSYIFPIGTGLALLIQKRLPFNGGMLWVYLLFTVPFAHPSVIIRASILRDNNIGYSGDYKNAEDFELWTRLVDKGSF